MNFGKKLIVGSFVAVLALVVLLVMQSSTDIVLSSRDDAPVSVDEITLYCAAGLKTPVLEAAKEFERRYSVRVNLEYGGSGTLLSKLEIARRGDLYLAADQSYTEKAHEMGLLVEQLPLAYMHPALVVPKGNPKNVEGIQDLYRKDLRVSLGNPGAASIGRETKALLAKAGIWEKVKAQVTVKGVFKPTVPELANDVKLGAVDAAVIWDALLIQYPELELVPALEFDEAVKNVTVGVLNSSKHPTMALRFARFLNSKEGNVIFRKNGFTAVEGDDWAWKPEVTFFCGSVNRGAIAEVLKKFQEREGVVVNTKYNGCGILTADMKLIKKGEGDANFPDAYMACDRYYLNNVKEWFQEAVEISDTDIVIVVPKGNPAGITGIKDLAKDGVKISLGQCDQCTIGALTKIMLQREDIYDRVMKNVKVQTASSSMLVPTVIRTKNMKTVLDATLAYRVDTFSVANQVEVIPIHSINATAIQPFGLSSSSDHKYIVRRLQAAVMAAEHDFTERGFNFRVGKGADE